MKHLLLAALLIITLMAFTENKPKTRYYFFGYHSDENGKQSIGGFYVSSDNPSFMSNNEAKEEIMDYYKLSGNTVITSIYEFKNKQEFDQSQK